MKNSFCALWEVAQYLEYGFYTADNHQNTNYSLEILAAYLFKAPRAYKRAYENAADAYRPECEGVACEESCACAKEGVEYVKDHRERLHRGHILHFVFYGAYAVEYNWWPGHSKHTAHNAACRAYEGACCVCVEQQGYFFLPKEKVERHGYKHHAQAALHTVVAQRRHKFYGKERYYNIKKDDDSHAAPTYRLPVPQGDEESCGTGQEPRQRDRLAVGGEYKREKHHHKYSKAEAARPLYEAGCYS